MYVRVVLPQLSLVMISAKVIATLLFQIVSRYSDNYAVYVFYSTFLTIQLLRELYNIYKEYQLLLVAIILYKN
jgi:hypothetical protein